MWNLIPLACLQSLLLTVGQVMLKFALMRMETFGWNARFWRSVLLNWPFAACGLCYAIATILWMYLVKKFPFSAVYPMVSLSFVFGMFAALFIFHEQIPITRWLGVTLIVLGTLFIAK